MKISKLYIVLLTALSLVGNPLQVEAAATTNAANTNSDKYLADIHAKKKLKPTKKQSNAERVPSLDILFGKLAANFERPFNKKIVIYKKLHSKFLQLHNLDLEYDPVKNSKNLGFSIKQDTATSLLFSDSFSHWFNGLRKNPSLLSSLVDLYSVPVGAKQKTEKTFLANVARKIVVMPKITLPNVKKITLYVDDNNNILMADVWNKQLTVYDFSQSIKPEMVYKHSAVRHPTKKSGKKNVVSPLQQEAVRK